MKNKNEVRAKVRKAIYNEYHWLFEKLHLKKIDLNLKHDLHKTKEGKKIVHLFRTNIGYSKKTADRDIFWTAYKNWQRQYFTGKSMYNSYKCER